MDIEKFREYCITKKWATEGFPFKNLPDTLVFKVAGKMFAAVSINTFKSIGVRCNSDEIDELRATYPALQKPSYFSDRHWTKIVLDNSLSDEFIFQWIDNSYDLALKKLTKKERNSLE
ncbi:MmcQ/YjbR family DNA-binding protein [Empedobacter sedimenti]|uniref:MmcQ/YjbR family DNA-binding protein n=1 Tax=Empedobacter sedimenti TaxID=3042610 RepID=UPI0024A6B287|nr:MmcQ/YjbR family DNA-binding protein [Empedobacter sedimenti]